VGGRHRRGLDARAGQQAPAAAFTATHNMGSSELTTYTIISIYLLQHILLHYGLGMTIHTAWKVVAPQQLLIFCIGGAERLIVDAACQLAAHDHDVHVFTSHHDKKRCFEETLSGKSHNFDYVYSVYN
jgi:hypothetical protein